MDRLRLAGASAVTETIVAAAEIRQISESHSQQGAVLDFVEKQPVPRALGRFEKQERIATGSPPRNLAENPRTVLATVQMYT
jgi:hypothetical protein